MRQLTRVERRRYEDVRREWLVDMPDDPESDFLVPALDECPDFPPTIPIFDAILVSDDGSVWVWHKPWTHRR